MRRLGSLTDSVHAQRRVSSLCLHFIGPFGNARPTLCLSVRPDVGPLALTLITALQCSRPHCAAVAAMPLMQARHAARPDLLLSRRRAGGAHHMGADQKGQPTGFHEGCQRHGVWRLISMGAVLLCAVLLDAMLRA
jgi:hypothetical protein